MRTGFKFTGQGIFTYVFTCEQDQHLKHSSCLECSLLLLLSQYSSLSAQRWSLCSLLQMMAIGRHVEVSGGLHGGGWGGACDALSIHECCLSRARNAWERLGQPGVDLLIEPRGLWVRWLGAPGLPSEILASFEMVGLPPLAWQRPAALQGVCPSEAIAFSLTPRLPPPEKLCSFTCYRLAQARVSHLWQYRHFGLDNSFLWGLSCVL